MQKISILAVTLCVFVAGIIMLARYFASPVASNVFAAGSKTNFNELNSSGAVNSSNYASNKMESLREFTASTNSTYNSNKAFVTGPTLSNSINTNEEVFKVVFDTNTGDYFCTDAGRQNFYMKWKNGKTFSTNSITDVLRLPPAASDEDRRIRSMTMVDGHIEISIGNSNYVLIGSKEGTGQN